MRAGAHWVCLLSLGLGVTGAVSAFGPNNVKPSRPPKVDFSRQILPILSDKCFKCHGPDAGSRMAGLRLDTQEGAAADRNGRRAVVPGNPQTSLLVQRIRHPETPMPPRDSGKSLTLEEIELLTRWIAEGAVYAKLWSLAPLPSQVPVPDVRGLWPRDDLDRFILARLKVEGLSPNPPAPPLRWLRRVSFDLTGLPPTLEDIAAFENDKTSNRYETVVDRLLASPHFGERMAVEWLDAARYSDSYGYQSDLLMPTWPYRDWAVRAFNANLSYDQFLTQQIAGDILPNATTETRLATAFNRLHRQSNEGGSIAQEFKTEYAADRVDTFGTAFLGLTLGCARCHDHKFDPITQREYYQFFAYFNSIQEFGLLLSTEIVPTPSLLLPTTDQEKRLAELKRKASEAQARAAQSNSSNDVPVYAFAMAAGKERFESTSPKIFAQKLGSVEFEGGPAGEAARFDGENGLVVRGLGSRERWDPFTWTFALWNPGHAGPAVVLHRTGGTDVGFCGFDLMLEEGRLTARVMRHWPGNALAIRTKEPLPKERWSSVAWSYDGSGQAEGLRIYVDGKPAPVETLSGRLWKRIHAYGDLGPSGGDWAFGQRFRDAGLKGGKIASIAYAESALTDEGVAALSRSQLLVKAPSRESAAQADMRRAERELAEFEDTIREISVMEEADPPIEAYLLARGAYDAPKNESNRVARGVPKVLPALPDAPRNDRLALARWAVLPDHPLTARVAVNRLWQMLFGSGLVESSENFGTQGTPPTHPELLDYLARQFVLSRWNVKALLRRIVLSATYRQDSARSPALAKSDPLNRLYARGPSGRLSAEMVRDLALAASGLLDDRIGGPPVNPYQPAGIWQEFNTMSPGFVQSKGADLYRRSLYSTWKRTTPVPNMLLFDATSREACAVRRPSTNTPLQALVLLNDVQFVEAARALAERSLKTQPDDSDRIRWAFRRLAGRSPSAAELQILLQTLQDQRRHFRQDLDGAFRLIRVGDSIPDPLLRPSELAAWTVTMQTILNSDAVVWKR